MKLKHFIVIQLLYSLIIFSFSIPTLCLAQGKTIKSDAGKSFDDKWQEHKAKAIVKEICQGWNIVQEYENYLIEGPYLFSQKGIQKRFFHFCPEK